MNNLLKRTIFGALYLVVMVFGIIWDRAIFTALFAFILMVGLREFYAMGLGRRYIVQQKIATLCAILAYLNLAYRCFFGGQIDLWWVPMLLMFAIPVSTVFVREFEDFSSFGLIYAGLGYVALPIVLLPLVMMDGEVFDGWLLLSFFIIIWASDVGAYCVGTLLGQKPDSRKLAPAISPKKSWWGVAGGVVLGIGASALLSYLTWMPFPMIHCLALGFLVSAAGITGDLFESMWKRHFHVKDSGSLIPGHGGILDRIDSSLVAIPLAYVYLLAFSLI